MISRSPTTLILQLSDIHLFSDPTHSLLGLNTTQSFDAVLERVRQLSTRPDAILLTGDLSQDESDAAYRHLYQKFVDFDIPIYWVPGNHDNPAVMARSLDGPPFRSDRCFQLGGWQFILLDSSVAGQVHGQLSAEALEQLDQDLHRSSSMPTLVALHHPPFTIPSQWLNSGLKNYEALWQVLERHAHVQLVLCGHIHQDYQLKRNGICYMSTPSTCIQFAPNHDQFAVEDIDPGFRLIELAQTGCFHSWVERVPVHRQLDVAAQGY